MFKRILSILLLISMALGMGACKVKNDQGKENEVPKVTVKEYDFSKYVIAYDTEGTVSEKCARKIKNCLRKELLLDVPLVKAAEDSSAARIEVGTLAVEQSPNSTELCLPGASLHEYGVFFRGEPISIVANDDLALERATKYFTTVVLSGIQDGLLTIAEDFTYTDGFMEDTNILDNGVQLKTQQITTIYGPVKGNVTPTLSYARIIELAHNGEQNGALYATSESLDVEKYLIHRSGDGGKTWQIVGEVTSQMNGMVANWQPMLFELPCDVGDLDEGTLLLAGCIRTPHTTQTKMCIYVSRDLGQSWKFYSTVAEGSGFSQTGGLSKGLWEPFLLCDDDGKLWCFYSDETQAEQHSQMLVCRSSMDGKNWSETQQVVAARQQSLRPGMITVTRLGDGRYLATYEIVGMDNNPIYFKITDDLNDWNPSDIGERVATRKGNGFGSAPYCQWIPAGGECGTLIVTAMFNYGKTDKEAADWLISFDYGETWENIENPLYYNETKYLDTRYAYSPGLFAGADGKTLYYVNCIPSQKIKGKTDMVLAVMEISRMSETE